MFASNFSDFVSCPFPSLVMFFDAQIFLIFIKLFSFVDHVFGVISKKNLLSNSKLWRFIPIFSSKSFMVFILIFMLFICCDVYNMYMCVYVCVIIYVYTYMNMYLFVHSLACGTIQFPQDHLLYTFLSLLKSNWL